MSSSDVSYLFDSGSVHKVLDALGINLRAILKVVEEIVMLDQSDIELLTQFLRYSLNCALIFLSCIDHNY